MKALIIGVPGVGKTTILKGALEKLENYKTINFGTEMLKAGKEKGIVKNRDQLRKLNPEKEKKLQLKAVKKIKKEQNLLIDTHLAIETKKGLLPGMPHRILKEINPERIILIETNAEDIIKRRRKDETREREDFKIDPATHQDINRAHAATASTLTGALIKIIKNQEGKIDKAVDELVNTLEE